LRRIFPNCPIPLKPPPASTYSAPGSSPPTPIRREYRPAHREKARVRSLRQVPQKNSTREGSSECGVRAPPHSMPAFLRNKTGRSAAKDGRGPPRARHTPETVAARREATRAKEAPLQEVWPHRPQQRTERAARDAPPVRK